MSVAYIFNGANNEYIWHSLKAMNSFYMEPPAPSSRPMQWRPYKHPITTHCSVLSSHSNASAPSPLAAMVVWWYTKCAYC